ncbi:MAG TPA: adenosine deaminase [Candidatus Eisenbacteria bacterium]|nr:adenosine deaminase [Candidatus Eisenbacteria bacterium]
MRRSPPRRRTSPWVDPDRRRRLLLALPKTDLHVHLDGSLRPESLLEMGREQGLRLPIDDADALDAFLDSLTSGVSLPEYLKAFDLTLRVLQTREALVRAAFELAEDSHRENVRYLEVRYCPALHTRRGLSMGDTVEAVQQGLRRARTRYGIESGIIICGIRHKSPRLTNRLAEVAVAYAGKGVVAFDLAGAERDFPAKAHSRAFRLVAKNNMNVTVHAGEAFGPESIAQALHYCSAHRIGHGTRLGESREILDYVNDHRIPLEMCLTSNIQTGAVRRASAHPFLRYLRRGLRVTLNTDNRLVSRTTMTQELDRAVTAFKLTPNDVRHVLVNGFKSAFLPVARKAALLRASLREMDALFRHAGVLPPERGPEVL